MSKAETLIPVLRHGQFDGPGARERNYTNFVASLTNESKIYPLTDIGTEQILGYVKEIHDYEKTDLILTSTFLRTWQSGQVVAKEIKNKTGRNTRIIRTPLLDTIWMPPHTLSENDFLRLEQNDRNAVANSMFDKWSTGQTGETPEMVAVRINKFINFLAFTMHQTCSKQPMVITHSSFASATYRHIQGLNLTSPRNKEEILKLAGNFFIVTKGDLGMDLYIDSSKDKFLA